MIYKKPKIFKHKMRELPLTANFAPPPTEQTAAVDRDSAKKEIIGKSSISCRE